jgi:hypothetical protein
MTFELARYWAEYMSNHGTSATLTAMPEDQIDEIYQACEFAFNNCEKELGDLHIWAWTVVRDIHSGIYKPAWRIDEDLYHAHKAATEQAERKQYVYLLWTSAGIYKIGYTENPQRRLAEFKAMPFQCKWECLIESDNGRALEAELHKRFKSKVLPPKREWFSLSLEDVDYVKSLAVQA